MAPSRLFKHSHHFQRNECFLLRNDVVPRISPLFSEDLWLDIMMQASQVYWGGFGTYEEWTTSCKAVEIWSSWCWQITKLRCPNRSHYPVLLRLENQLHSSPLRYSRPCNADWTVSPAANTLWKKSLLVNVLHGEATGYRLALNETSGLMKDRNYETSLFQVENELISRGICAELRRHGLLANTFSC